jgi:predicted NUDIX family NTP pyrophosphohydrolase
MKKISAGILVYKRHGSELQVLLLRLGGPFWQNKDSWTIPKGEVEVGEDDFKAAKREFREEVGMPPPDGDYFDLGTIDQSSAKTNHIWAVEGEMNLAGFKCNTFSMEWPPNSGRIRSFPECDQAEWFTLEMAKSKLLAAQKGFIDKLESHLGR